MRPVVLTFVMVALGAALACGTSQNSPSPKPANTIECQTPPIGSSAAQTCHGICVAQPQCTGEDAETATCPLGTANLGTGACANGGLCCVFPDGGEPGGDASSDAAEDASSDAGGDARADG